MVFPRVLRASAVWDCGVPDRNGQPSRKLAGRSEGQSPWQPRFPSSVRTVLSWRRLPTCNGRPGLGRRRWGLWARLARPWRRRSRRETRLVGQDQESPRRSPAWGVHPMPFRFWTTSVTTCSQPADARLLSCHGDLAVGYAIAGRQDLRSRGVQPREGRRRFVADGQDTSGLLALQEIAAFHVETGDTAAGGRARRAHVPARFGEGLPLLPDCQGMPGRGEIGSRLRRRWREPRNSAKGLTGAEIDGSCWEVLAGSYAWFGEVAKVRRCADAARPPIVAMGARRCRQHSARAGKEAEVRQWIREEPSPFARCYLWLGIAEAQRTGHARRDRRSGAR